MYRNFMVKEVKTDRALKRITKVLKDNRIHYYLRNEGTVIEANVGSARKSTKRFDICSKLGFKKKES